MSPFPGMDPYLEERSLWNDMHHRLITYLSNALQQQVRPRYHVRIEERMYVEESKREILPDVSLLQKVKPEGGGTAVLEAAVDSPIILNVGDDPLTEGVIHIIDRAHGMRVVTVIEILSPTNKEPHSKGYGLYRKKQEEILESTVHLIEIDLLRGGEYILAPPYGPLIREVGTDWHYMISICKGDAWGTYFLYPRTIRDRLPVIPVPLAGDDPDARLDLQPLLARCYEDGAYEDLIDYRQDPPPPALSEEDLKWIDDLLKTKRLR